MLFLSCNLGEILKRKKGRDRKARDEKRRERKIQAEENKKMGHGKSEAFSRFG